ncbi:unnamed protein product [Schistosoma rodhaini]|uniref:C2H2-type domain-containing protein n=1 Tax=Schistosoma rodhaini TaxID=6188 RepID=A0AA85GJB0_9TREM|nr:unnamed protein product [Schistosoma rodhaini]
MGTGSLSFPYLLGQRSKMNNYTGQYGYMFPMQPNYAWGPNQAHTPVQEPQYTYGYDSNNHQPPPYTDYMGPQAQDYESPVNDFNGQYGCSTNSTPTQPGYSAQWGGSQFQTPSHDSSYWYHSREPPTNSQPRYQPPPSTPILEQNRKPKLRIYCKYCDVAFTDENTYSIHLDTERHIRNFKRSFNTTEDRRGKGKSRSDYRRNNNKNRKPNFYCEDCKRSFQRKEQYRDHITAEGHMKKSDRNKNESDEGESKKAPRRTDYCDVCEQTFQNGRHFYAHLKWKKHKRLCRVARLLRAQLKKTPEEVANDPLGSFTLYMNKGKSLILENSKFLFFKEQTITVFIECRACSLLKTNLRSNLTISHILVQSVSITVNVTLVYTVLNSVTQPYCRISPFDVC